MEILKIIDNRINHNAINNEITKDIRIDELKILKLIIKDYAQIK